MFLYGGADKGRHFSSDADVIAAVQTWFDGQLSEFFFEWLAKVKEFVAVRAKNLSATRYCLVYCFSIYAASFLFLYKSTAHCHRVETRRQYINIHRY